MTIEQIQEMITKLQCELNLAITKKKEEERKIEDERNKDLSQKFPGLAEARARFRQICDKFKIDIKKDSIAYVLQPLFNIENNLRKKDPKYRYKPKTSAALNTRVPGKTNFSRKKTTKNNQEEMDLK